MRRSGVFFGMVVVLLAAGWAPASNMAFAFRVNLGVAVESVGKARLGTTLSAGTVLTCVAATLAVGLIALVLAWREAGPRRGVLVQAAVRGNLVHMGFPVIFAASGAGGLFLQ